MENQENIHKRRVRYKGTHPKRFEEKYKEQHPEAYPETVQRVISKGSTPAGMHIPICVEEILEFLQIKPGQIGLDATLGYGGHSQAMLACLQGEGHLYGLDVDPAELPKTRERLASHGYGPEIFTACQLNFADIDILAREAGPFDFILADLGVSSMQIDNPARGFSYKKDGPLDLRLNPEKGMSAAKRLKEVSKEELIGMLDENADEPYAKELAAGILAARKRKIQLDTTGKLRQVIEKSLDFLPDTIREEEIKKSCARTFQALRIDVNSEFEVLDQLMEKLPMVLAPGGRAAVLTFHSGEDRIVKKAFKYYQREGLYEAVAEKVIRPSAEECARNSRARSTKMRWAIKKKN